jgi:hypothetical protein
VEHQEPFPVAKVERLLCDRKRSITVGEPGDLDFASGSQAPAGRTTTQGNWRWLRRVQAFAAAAADKWAKRAR